MAEITKREDPPIVPSAAVIVNGDITMRELPESGIISRGDISRITLHYKGSKADLKTAQPGKGAAVAGYTGYEVESSVLSPGNGDLAELEIVLVPEPPGDTFVAEVIRDTYDIDWMRVEKPIETAAFLGDEDAQAEAAILLDLWRNAEPRLRAQFKYVDEAGAEVALTDKVLLAAKKIIKGVEGYLEFVPIVQRVRAYRGRPTTGGCGKIESPPAYAISGYEFLKTADRLSDPGVGVAVRTEEWTGLLKWDQDLYGEQPAQNGGEE